MLNLGIVASPHDFRYFVGGTYAVGGSTGLVFRTTPCFDSSNNFYLVGDQTSDSTEDWRAFYGATPNAGSKLIDPAWGLGTTNPTAYASMVIDGSDNVYIGGEYATGGTPSLAKFDISGTNVFYKNYDFGGAITPNGMEQIATDSSGNIYGLTAPNSWKSMFMKFDSSGTLTWAKGNSNTGSWRDIALQVDGSGNLYIGGGFTTSTASNGYDFYMSKRDSNGNIIWGRTNTFFDAGSYIVDCKVLSDGTVIVVGNAVNGSVSQGYLAALNGETGAEIWEKLLPSNYIEQIVVDAEDNIYALGNVPGGGSTSYIMKFGSDGTFVYNRSITAPDTTSGSGTRNPTSITIDLEGNLVLGTQMGMIYKLPTDGSRLGTWTTSFRSGLVITIAVAATPTITAPGGGSHWGSTSISTATWTQTGGGALTMSSESYVANIGRTFLN